MTAAEEEQGGGGEKGEAFLFSSKATPRASERRSVCRVCSCPVCVPRTLLFTVAWTWQCCALCGIHPWLQPPLHRCLCPLWLDHLRVTCAVTLVPSEVPLCFSPRASLLCHLPSLCHRADTLPDWGIPSIFPPMCWNLLPWSHDTWNHIQGSVIRDNMITGPHSLGISIASISVKSYWRSEFDPRVIACCFFYLVWEMKLSEINRECIRWSAL